MMITGIILAGGKSRRMGRDKGLMELGGRKIVERIIDALIPSVSEILIITDRTDDYSFLNHPILEDLHKGKGPLAGIYTGLLNSRTDGNFIAGCDYPLLEPDFVRRVIEIFEHSLSSEGFEILIPEVDGKIHPLCSIYRRRCLASIKDNLQRGDLRVQSLCRKAKTHFIKGSELAGLDIERNLFNLNRPEELAKLMELL
ncbi:MAG: molybdenum cofactor guanylyltransferase [Acidobacteriota bacterium]